MLEISNGYITAEGKQVVSELNLSVPAGTVQVLMGPNGSGKSSCAYALAGHPDYQITSGTAIFMQKDLLSLSPDQRACAGLFLSMQYPPELPGVNVCTFLSEAYNRIHATTLDISAIYRRAEDIALEIGIDRTLLARNVHEGFSGGEKKQLELIQLMVLTPRMAILDEIDSGLDIDALKRVARGIGLLRQENPTMGLLLITHYQRILEYIIPDQVHIMNQGTITHTGGMSLVQDIELMGYDGL